MYINIKTLKLLFVTIYLIFDFLEATTVTTNNFILDYSFKKTINWKLQC